MATNEEFEQQKAAILKDLGNDAHVDECSQFLTISPKDRAAATKVSRYLAEHKIEASVDMTDAPVRPLFHVHRPSNPSSCIIL